MIIEVADRSVEMHFLTGKDGGRYPRVCPAKATRVTTTKDNSHEEPTWN
jgi:hypothetical protein